MKKNLPKAKTNNHFSKPTTHVKEVSLRDVLAPLKEKKDACIIILDELTDVHNVGAIIRSATASGCDAIVVSKHNQAPINDTVMRTSAHTAGILPIIQSNINDAIRVLKDNGFWVHGLFMDGDGSLWKNDLTGKVAIVVGSEDEGIHAATKKLCDFSLAIPMDARVESLNASVAAALAMYERARQISL